MKPGDKPWPLKGYAPGHYTNKCIRCEEQFEGDKRAIHCLECAVVVLRDTRPTPENGLREALEDFCLSAECAAGVDEGASEDTAASEIMSSMGSAMAVSYINARLALSQAPR